MENLDIYILTSIVATLFLTFVIGTYRILQNVDEDSHKYEKEGGPRVQMIKFVGRLFDDQSIPKKEKKIIYEAVRHTLADMESDGVYFPIEVAEKLYKHREELMCEYSGLLSPKAYETVSDLDQKQLLIEIMEADARDGLYNEKTK